MKSKKTKLITTILASALGVAALSGGILLGDGLGYQVASAATETTYLASGSDGIFEASSGTEATILSPNEENATNYVQFEFKTAGKVKYNKRSVALQWMSAKGVAEHFSTTFALTDANFKTIAMVMETEPATATKEDKSVNKVLFKMAEDGNSADVYVNDTKTNISITKTELEAGKTVTIELQKTADCAYGEYQVYVDGNAVTDGTNALKFTNIAANAAEFVSGEITPLYFEATMPEAAEGSTNPVPASIINFMSLNGQSFELTDGKIVDNTAPVLVVNDEISALQLGKPLSVDHIVIDVLDKTPTTTKKYYQFNPDHFDGVDDPESISYIGLSDTKAFLETQYSGGTVFNNYDNDNDGNPEYQEYVSIKFELEDENFKADTKVTYELSWYAKDFETISGIDYVLLDKNEIGPWYTIVEFEENSATGEMENKRVDSGNLVEAYQGLVNDAADGLFAGTGAYIYLPSLIGLISDNDGYQNLQFNISYKKQSSTSNSSVTGLAYDAVKFSVAEDGMYEFKVYATDAAGNKMQMYVDGELVDLTSENVWDIDAIPSFTFTVKSPSMKVEEKESNKVSNRKKTQALDTTYSLTAFNVLGVTNPSSQYGLFYVDYDAFNQNLRDKLNVTDKKTSFLTNKDLYAIDYDELAKKSATDELNGTANLAPEDEIDYFLKVYAYCLADVINDPNVTGADLVANDYYGLFRKIEAFDSRINETDHAEEWAKNNKYNWQPSSQSFKTVDEGSYLMLASFTNTEVPAMKVSAYKIIIAEDEVDVLPGEDDWLENNIVSVILFAVAGVMLVLIIVLLFVKTDNETLEDVDEKLAKDKKKKSKKAKKAPSKKEKAVKPDEEEKS